MPLTHKDNTMIDKPYIQIAEELIKEAEDLELKPYRDTVGKLTIGYGRNLEDSGITEEEAKYLLAQDQIRSHNELTGNFAFFQKMDPVRQAVLADMHMNMGLPRLLTFKKMLTACQFQDWDTAAAELMDSKYFRQTHSRAKRNYMMMKFGRIYTREEAVKFFNDNHMGI